MQNVPERYVSIAEFSRRSSLSRGTLYNMVERQEIPPPSRLTANRIAWPVEVVDAWFASRQPGEGVTA